MPWAELIRKMASAFYNTSSHSLKDLRQSSEKLNILAETFARTLLQRHNTQKQISVFFFNETKDYRGVRVGFSRAKVSWSCIDSSRLYPNKMHGYQATVIMLRSMRTMSICVNSMTGMWRDMRVLWQRFGKSHGRYLSHDMSL